MYCQDSCCCGSRWNIYGGIKEHLVFIKLQSAFCMHFLFKKTKMFTHLRGDWKGAGIKMRWYYFCWCIHSKEKLSSHSWDSWTFRIYVLSKLALNFCSTHSQKNSCLTESEIFFIRCTMIPWVLQLMVQHSGYVKHKLYYLLGLLRHHFFSPYMKLWHSDFSY